MSRIAGKATGQAVTKACSQRVKNPGAMPVSIRVTMQVINVAINNDMIKANNKPLYFLGIFMLYNAKQIRLEALT